MALGSLIIPEETDMSNQMLEHNVPINETDCLNQSIKSCHHHVDVCVRTLSLDSVSVDGGIGPSCSTARLQDVLTHPPSDTGQLGGLQDERLAVLGQQLGSTLIAGKWRHALNLLACHVTAGA